MMRQQFRIIMHQQNRDQLHVFSPSFFFLSGTILLAQSLFMVNSQTNEVFLLCKVIFT